MTIFDKWAQEKLNELSETPDNVLRPVFGGGKPKLKKQTSYQEQQERLRRERKANNEKVLQTYRIKNPWE